MSGQSVLRWCCSAGWVLGLRTRGQRWKVYMANKVSSGLSGFLRLGVPCGAPGLPLGGVGRLGAISAALARSSRNLSNSGSKGKRGCEFERRGDENIAETKQKVYWRRLPYLHLSHPPRRHLLSIKEKWHNVRPGSWLCKIWSTANHQKPRKPNTLI